MYLLGMYRRVIVKIPGYNQAQSQLYPSSVHVNWPFWCRSDLFGLAVAILAFPPAGRKIVRMTCLVLEVDILVLPLILSHSPAPDQKSTVQRVLGF